MKAQRRRGPAATIPATIGYLHWGAPLAASTADRPGGADHGALLDALGQVAPRVEPDPPDGCYLDLGDRPSGVPREPALAEWGAAILAIAREGGYPAARLGVSTTPGAAQLAARHGPANPTVLDGAGVAPFLAALPVRCLELDGATLERLALVGLRMLGDLAALPRRWWSIPTAATASARWRRSSPSSAPRSAPAGGHRYAQGLLDVLSPPICPDPGTGADHDCLRVRL